jgi:hypothetical protein
MGATELLPGLSELGLDQRPLLGRRVVAEELLEVADPLTEPMAAVDHTRHGRQRRWPGSGR